MDTPQNADGTAHMAYYSLPHLLSFIWDGKSDTIQISHGGYREPVYDTIHVGPVDQHIEATPANLMDWFKHTCEAYVEVNAGNLP